MTYFFNFIVLTFIIIIFSENIDNYFTSLAKYIVENLV